jgi:hypothetical protein
VTGVRILPDPVPPETVSRYAWSWLEGNDPVLGYPYADEDEARRIGRPPAEIPAVLVEIVLPRTELCRAIATAPDPAPTP